METFAPAETLLMNWLADFCEQSPEIAGLHHELALLTSTRLFDWIDHFLLPEREEQRFKEVGFVMEERGRGYTVLRHPDARLPRVVLSDQLGVAVRVELVADFLMVRGWARVIEGSPYSSYRRALIGQEREIALWVVERRASRTLDPMSTADSATRYLQCKEAWQARPRDLLDEEVAMQAAMLIADHMVKSVGQHMAAWIVLEVEREYWQSRNRLAQLERGRLDHLGMGWGNHDHHAFRSSRHLYPMLVALFEKLGFRKRERLLGGQVMENGVNGLVLTLCVDLEPDEEPDQPLEEWKRPGEVGLWCGLHGDSILQGGLHHLGALYLFENMQDHLEGEVVSDLHHFKRARSDGEVWAVSIERLDRMLELGWIDSAERYREEGAIGSRLENIQRRDGFKGL